MAKDPICNVEVDEQSAEFKSQYGSKTYYFRSEECKNEFESRPEHYAAAA
jgi:YHS domain-containing protein